MNDSPDKASQATPSPTSHDEATTSQQPSIGGLVWEQTPHSNKTTRWALCHDGTRVVSWYSPGDGTGSELTRTLRQGWYCSIFDADPRSIAGPFPTEVVAQTVALFLEHNTNTRKG